MRHESVIDEATGRKFYLDAPDDTGRPPLTFLLNLHGGGSFGAWQRLYFPAHDYADTYRPGGRHAYGRHHGAVPALGRRGRRRASAERGQPGLRPVRPGRHRVLLAGRPLAGRDDLRPAAEQRRSSPDRVDGWLSLSGGRIGGVPRAEGSGPPAHPGGPQPSARRAELQRLRAGPRPPDADLSFIFATGEHEIMELPASRPGRSATAPAPASASRTSSTPSPARSGTRSARATPPGSGACCPGRAPRRSTSTRTRATAGSSPTSSGWTRATPRVWSRRSPRNWSR